MKRKKSSLPAKTKAQAKNKKTASTSSKKKAGLKKAKVRLSQKLKAEILDVYNEGWEAYMKGDLKTHGFHLSNNFKIIGSSEAEQFNSKKEWLAYCKKTIKQYAGVIQLKNRKIKLVLVGEEVMVVENADIYVLIDEKWSFYARIRITALLQREKTGWKYIHQHGSLPDGRANEGEVIATAQIKKENLRLKEAVKRRTIELENKTHELEIEASLERVRTVAMGMTKPEDMLKICRVISEQLQQFGVAHIRNIQTVIINQEKGTYHNYQYFKPYKKEVLEVVEYHKNPVTLELVNRMMESADGFFTGTLTGDVFKEWRTYRKRDDQLPDPLLDETESVHYHFYSIGPGGLGITLYRPLNEEGLEIFMRFHQVFSLAYQRFRDIEQAVAQAREAQIEAAVERVRAQSMAMHRTVDLNNVTHELLNQLNALKVEGLTGTSIYLVDANDNVTVWDMSSPGSISDPGSYSFTYDAKKYPILGGWVDIWRNSTLDYFVLDFPKESLVKAVSEMDEIFPEMAVHFKNAIDSGNLTHQWSPAARLSKGILAIDLITPPTEDTKTIVIKMAGAFNQAYQRFLDLQKAEAQAREAQIEAALEKVRSHSLAMHKSHELNEVVKLIFEKMTELKVPSTAIGIQTFSEDSNDVQCFVCGDVGNGMVINQYQLPYFDHPIINDYLTAHKNKLDFYVGTYSQKVKDSFYDVVLELPELKDIQAEIKAMVRESDVYEITMVPAEKSLLAVNDFIGNPLSESQINILKRFAKVFDQTYIRFLDLQKAEAQAREAQIEAALERVRAQTMAMHNSEDVGKCVVKMFAELTSLGVDEGTRFGIGILNHDNENNQLWTAKKDGAEVKLHIGNLDMTSHPLLKSARNAWKEQVPFHKYVLEGEDLRKYYQMLNTAPDYKIQIQIEKLPEKEIQHCFIFEHGFFYAFTPHEFQPDLLHIIQRFSLLFAQTYRRYLDLVKAEAQAREAQIETALEKVRSRAIAMQKSDELLQVIKTLSEQLRHLGLHAEAVSFLTDGDEKGYNMWLSSPGEDFLSKIFVPRILDRTTLLFLEAKENGKRYYSYVLSKEEKDIYFQNFFDNTVLRDYPDNGKEQVYAAPGMTTTNVLLDSIVLSVSNFDILPYSDQENEIINRVASVFQQTYTRFIDLQKAEVQAREAQIEAALERVRSRSMAMHKSEELLSVITVVSEQLQHLNFKFNTVSFAINNQAHDYTFWFAIMGDPKPIYIQVPYIENPMFDRLKDVLYSGADFYADTLTPDESKQWHEHVFAYANIPSMNEETRAYILRSGYSRSIAIKPSIMLVVSNYAGQPYSDDQNEIIKRFATVFEQSYTRFLDLQRAEAQAREAKIEAALERVRSRSLAMHKSEELQEVVNTVSAGLVELGVKMDSANFNILHEGSRDMDLWVANIYSQRIHIPYIDLKPIRNLMDARDKGINSLQVACTYEEKNIFWNEAFERTGFKTVATAERKKYILDSKCWTILWTLAKHCGIQLNSYSRDSYTEEEVEVMKRFTNVFEQAYVRFLDLQKAEIQAREAVKQSSLDRVRGEIASMRTTADLDRITPLIWKELNTLGISFIRCGVFIMDEHQNKVHTYLSTPDGQAIAAFHTPMDDSGSLVGAIEHWLQQKVFLTHWVESDFQTQADILLKQGSIATREQYLETLPKEGFHLHFLPFRQGMLYVGSNERLSDDALQLVQSLADAFSVAYARYEDFTKLESAKQQIEKTLADLKQTQSQLVQSEKMASLGELTAGIAHEIQNPLNFVNNFSEVSNELIKEIQDIRRKTQDTSSNKEENELLNDIAGNLEKISHHGKRAADIVKGMLQHSRSSTGVKESTDINALVDEYLRLAYHGLRAKDKSFNASMKTEFDDSIGNVNVVPQDIGRVILNLITNAFYVVNERAKYHHLTIDKEPYTPTVLVTTKKVGDTIEIRVKDNGPGIPDSIKEKIFQPFFTTKPTGQGTGLGLSLSYDIVKAHGGELKVETKEKEGSIFTINLPSS